MARIMGEDLRNRAMSFGYELISETDRLQEFPELGRIVPSIGTIKFAKSSFGRIESRTIHKRRFLNANSEGFFPRQF